MVRLWLTLFTGRACRWFFFVSSHKAVADFFFRLHPSLFFQVVPVVDFYCQLARVPRWLLFQVAPIAKFFHRSRLSLIVSQVAHVAEFSPRSRPSLIYLPARTNPSLTSLPMCAHRWLFPRSPPSLRFFQVAAVRRWLLFQLAPVADFFHMPRPSLIFSQVAHVADFFASLHKADADFFFMLQPSLFFRNVPVANFFDSSLGHLAEFFFKMCQSLVFSLVNPVADFFFKLQPSRNFFTGRACRWLCPRLRMSLTFLHVARIRRRFLLQVVHIVEFFPRSRPSLIFFASSHESVADFFVNVRTSWLFPRSPPSLNFFQVAPVRRWLLFQLAPVADFFTGGARRWFFPRLRMSPTFLPACTRPTLTSFSDCTRRCLFRNVPVANFLTVRLGTSLNSFSRCASRWFFPWLTPSLTFFSGCSRRGIFSQVAPVADCVPGCACRWLFSMSHESVADFFFRLCTSLNFFPDRARRWYFLPARTNPSLTSLSMCAHCWLFPRSPPSLSFSRVAHVTSFFASSLKAVADSFFMLRLSLTLFTGRACRWFFLPARTRPSLTSFSDCTNRFFFQVVPVFDFFCQLSRVPRWLTFQFALGARCASCWFFPRLSPSLTSFSGCARRGIFSQVAPVADCVPGCACRWLFSQIAPVADTFCQLAWIRRWLLGQCAHIADFFPGRPRRWVFSRSHQSVADFFFSLRPSLTFFTAAPVADFFPGCACRRLFCQLAQGRRWLLF